jgi:phasin
MRHALGGQLCGDVGASLAVAQRFTRRSSQVQHDWSTVWLVVVPSIGHSMKLELPARYAVYFGVYSADFLSSRNWFVFRERRSYLMSDTNLSADNAQAMLDENLERLREASAEYFDLREKGLSSSSLSVADQAKQFCGYMQRNVTATFDLGDKLIKAKDMQDAVKIQSDFFQDQMTDHAKSMGESAMKAATGLFTPKS